MSRRVVVLVCLSAWLVVASVCVWEWHVLGRCPNWTHDHHNASGASWALLGALLASWAAIWAGSRR